MAEPTLYDILQVIPTAEPEVISAAHRRLARKYHPDISPEPDAIERMKQLNAAYEVLRDPVRRREYDAQLLRTAAPAAPVGEPRPAGSTDGSTEPTREQPRPAAGRRPIVLPVSLGLLGTVALIGGFLWLTIEVLPGELRREGPRATATPAPAAAPASAQPTSPPPTATLLAPMPLATTKPTVAASPAPPPVAAPAEPATASPEPARDRPPTALADAPARSEPACQSLPESVQQGDEFDLVSLSQEQRELPVVGNVVVVSGSVRNNCQEAKDAELSFVLLDDQQREVGGSERPLRLDALQPGEARTFRFEPARAPSGSRIEIRASPR